MVIQFFAIIPSGNVGEWKCDIPIKDDASFYTFFPSNVKVMSVFGKKEYQDKSFVHILLNDKDNLIETVSELTEFNHPFSLENYQQSNEILSTFINTIFCPRFEDIFHYYPELEGTETITSQDEAGNEITTERPIIQTSQWSGNPLDYSIFESKG